MTKTDRWIDPFRTMESPLKKGGPASIENSALPNWPIFQKAQNRFLFTQSLILSLHLNLGTIGWEELSGLIPVNSEKKKHHAVCPCFDFLITLWFRSKDNFNKFDRNHFFIHGKLLCWYHWSLKSPTQIFSSNNNITPSLGRPYSIDTTAARWACSLIGLPMG